MEKSTNHTSSSCRSAKAVRVEDFQSISLFNSIYHIIAKVLENMLREVIGKFVGSFQSTFKVGKHLVDSLVVVAREIIAAYFS